MGVFVFGKTIIATILLVIIFASFAFLTPVYAHEGDTHKEYAGQNTDINIGTQIRDTSVKIIYVATTILAILVVISLLIIEPKEHIKKLIFYGMAITIVLPTVYFASSTIYLNVISETGGPVHWHADYKILTCGDELPPPIPQGFLSNKVGTPILHEHEDRRIHVEGVLVEKSEASLSSFFAAQGGELTNNSFTVPTGNSFVTFKNGDVCDGGSVGTWQVFLYTTNSENIVIQKKLNIYTDYILSPDVNVPPGDCIIFEFGPFKDRTTQMCDFYQIAIDKGELTYIR